MAGPHGVSSNKGMGGKKKKRKVLDFFTQLFCTCFTLSPFQSLKHSAIEGTCEASHQSSCLDVPQALQLPSSGASAELTWGLLPKTCPLQQKVSPCGEKLTNSLTLLPAQHQALQGTNKHLVHYKCLESHQSPQVK